VQLPFRGYRLEAGGRQAMGERASPVVCASDEHQAVTVAVPEFWQQFPKAISVDNNRLRVGLFPNEANASDCFELQGGEQKTHVVWLHIGDASIDRASGCRSLEWARDPVCVFPDAQWCDATDALQALDVETGESLERLKTLLEQGRSGPQGIAANREAVDEYGWRNYGDIFADHEQLHYHGTHQLISHYNNQFDMLHGFLIHALRDSDRTWWEWGDALARHVVDIDIYNTTEDKAGYNGGMFWFTDHYLHAHTSTHRTYSQHNRGSHGKQYGGGPSPEHNFTSGLLLHFCLTGNRDSRDAVLRLADWVIAMDDGGRNILGVLDDGPTGRVSVSRNRGLARAAGNSINALLDAWLVAGDKKYLDLAEALIRRCIHPNDDVAAQHLLNVERNWSYTIFLSALAKYLRLKVDADAFDDMFDYARASLVHYGEWMLENEQPYFDQIGELEFPTEAWAAQEFRKANVLRLAGQFADEPLRARMFVRGDELADRGWEDLLRFSTRTTARSLAIMMTEGQTDCALRSRPALQLPAAPRQQDFGRPEVFVSQRERIKQAAKTLPGVVRLVSRLANPVRWMRYLQKTSPNGTSRD
jgi:hypothetical protein